MADCHPDRRYAAKGKCRACYLRDYAVAHPEKAIEYRRRHAEKARQRSAEWYAANRERAAAREKARREADPTITRRQLAAKYGRTLEQRDALLARPCAICGGVSTDIDHDHATGLVRAALCGQCNSGIGQLGDDAERVARAATYLAAHASLLAVA